MTRPAASQRILRACARVVAAGCVALSLGAHAGEIHRCVEANGVTYTDRGCGDSSQAVVMVAAAGPGGLRPAAERDTGVTLGMSPRMVFDALGRPVETIATLQGRQLVEYWRYRSAPGGVTRVAFHEGRVTSVVAR